MDSEAGVVRWMLTRYRVVAWREIGPRYPLHLDAQRTDRDMRVLNLFDVWSKIVSFHRGSKRTERHSYLVRLVHLQSAWQASSRVRRSGSAECNYLNWRGAVWSKWRTPPELRSQTFFSSSCGVFHHQNGRSALLYLFPKRWYSHLHYGLEVPSAYWVVWIRLLSCGCHPLQ